MITSFTLVDFPSESELTTFFVFFENNIEALADELRANGMIKFYVTRVFNKEGKFTVGNWLEYKDAESYKTCDGIWAKFMPEKASKAGLVGKVAPYRCVVQYDYSWNLVCRCLSVFVRHHRTTPHFAKSLPRKQGFKMAFLAH